MEDFTQLSGIVKDPEEQIRLISYRPVESLTQKLFLQTVKKGSEPVKYLKDLLRMEPELVKIITPELNNIYHLELLFPNDEKSKFIKKVIDKSFIESKNIDRSSRRLLTNESNKLYDILIKTSNINNDTPIDLSNQINNIIDSINILIDNNLTYFNNHIDIANAVGVTNRAKSTAIRGLRDNLRRDKNFTKNNIEEFVQKYPLTTTSKTLKQVSNQINEMQIYDGKAINNVLKSYNFLHNLFSSIKTNLNIPDTRSVPLLFEIHNVTPLQYQAAAALVSNRFDEELMKKIRNSIVKIDSERGISMNPVVINELIDNSGLIIPRNEKINFLSVLFSKEPTIPFTGKKRKRIEEEDSEAPSKKKRK